MKMTKNHKILLGLAIGGGIAYLINRSRKQNAVAKTTIAPSGAVVDAENPTTREGKVEYILANTDSSAKEEMSGFSGSRFQFNPVIGYATPVGIEIPTNSGNQMIIGKEGNLANDIYFNAEGEESNDPTIEAEAILNEMTNEEVDVAYKMIKAKKHNPNLSYGEIANRLNYGDGVKALFKEIIRPRIQDLKALKKSRNWKSKWESRKRRFAGRVAKHKQRGMSPEALAKLIERKGKRLEDRLEGRGRKGGKGRRNDFAHQITDRKDGAVWGGHRNDGRATDKLI